MTSEDMTLSQAAIDALMSGAGSAPAPAAPAPAPPPSGATTPAASAPSAATTGEIAALWERIQKLETQLAQKGGGNAGAGQVVAHVQALSAQVQAITDQLAAVLQRLPNTLGYGVRESFVCRECQEKGLVAAVCVCTGCGTETVVGWWPQAQTRAA